MAYRIRRISVFPTAKLFAVMYGIGGLIAIPFVWIASRVASNVAGTMGGPRPPMFPFGGAAIILLPVYYAVIGFIVVAIGCAIYNVVAGWVGGIELELEATDGSVHGQV